VIVKITVIMTVNFIDIDNFRDTNRVVRAILNVTVKVRMNLSKCDIFSSSDNNFDSDSKKK
jgi:hypothetical protein